DPEVAVSSHPDDRLGPARAVVGTDIDGRVPANLLQTCRGRRYHRTSQRHRLEQRNSKSLGDGWERKTNRAGVECRQIVVGDIAQLVNIGPVDQLFLPGENAGGRTYD